MPLGLDFQRPTKLSYPSANTAKTDAGAAMTRKLEQFFLGYTLPAIHNLHHQSRALPLDADGRRVTAGMAVNVGETFLNNPEDCQFRICRQPAKVSGNLHIDVNFAAFRKTV